MVTVGDNCDISDVNQMCMINYLNRMASRPQAVVCICMSKVFMCVSLLYYTKQQASCYL